MRTLPLALALVASTATAQGVRVTTRTGGERHTWNDGRQTCARYSARCEPWQVD